MAQRKCSCCGTAYTDDDRHDYEQCVRDCADRVASARQNLSDALDCLENALSRRHDQRDGRIR